MTTNKDSQQYLDFMTFFKDLIVDKYNKKAAYETAKKFFDEDS